MAALLALMGEVGAPAPLLPWRHPGNSPAGSGQRPVDGSPVKPGEKGTVMSDEPVRDHPRTLLLCLCLVGAPLAEVIEQLLSPLTGGSTADDFAAVSGAPERFAASIAVGMIGTALLLPALLGLARRASDRSPTLGLSAAIVAGVSVLGFAGVRMSQVFELQLATGGLEQADAAREFDAAVGSPLGTVVLLAFLGGTVVGVLLLTIALWRSRRAPIGALVLLVLFPFIDFAMPTGIGTAASHLVLLASFTWICVALLRSAPVRRASRGGRVRDAAEGADARAEKGTGAQTGTSMEAH